MRGRREKRETIEGARGAEKGKRRERRQKKGQSDQVPPFAASLFVQLRICILIAVRRFGGRDLTESFQLNRRIQRRSRVSNVARKNHRGYRLLLCGSFRLFFRRCRRTHTHCRRKGKRRMNLRRYKNRCLFISSFECARGVGARVTRIFLCFSLKDSLIMFE